jgi:glyoxylase-like metal-dependent hydrolase (beta-lactamase superfamily II)
MAFSYTGTTQHCSQQGGFMRTTNTTVEPAYRPSLPVWAQLVAALALVAVGPGCDGDDGARGIPGERGSPGVDGIPGENGTPGTNGIDGTNGADGEDGTSVYIDQSLSPLEKAFTAIGGEGALKDMKGFTIVSSGVRSLTGEGFRPGDDALQVSTFDLTENQDLTNDFLRLDYTRNIQFLGFDETRMFSEIVRGNLGYVSGVEHLFGFPTGNMLSDRWAATRKQNRLLNPLLILRDIALNPAIATETGVRLLDGSVHHLITVEDGVYPITLYVNAATGWIAKATTVENDHLLRDVDIEVLYYGWEPTDGEVLFPTEVYLARDNQILHQEVRTSVTVNGGFEGVSFDFPPEASPTYDPAGAARGEASHQFHESFASFGIPLDGEQTFINPIQIAPGVFYLTGGSHNSLAVVQQNGIVMIEAPLYEARSEAILAWSASNFPGKPVTHVIATHHHDDHTGGLRTFVAAGAEVVIREESADFFKDIFRAKSSILPDALAQNPVAATIRTVAYDASFAIPDTARPVIAYPVETGHAVDMLMIYLPAQQVVFQSDLFNPGQPIPPPFVPNSMDLHTSITEAHELTVSLIVGGHGAISTFAEFEAFLGL